MRADENRLPVDSLLKCHGSLQILQEKEGNSVDLHYYNRTTSTHLLRNEVVSFLGADGKASHLSE